MKKTLILLSLLALAAGVAAAEEAVELDGKVLYRTNCKICHGPDSDAGEYTPMYLIQEQWDTFFNEDYADTHEGLLMPETETKVLDHLTEEMIKAIHEFCIEGAADSESPMTCG